MVAVAIGLPQKMVESVLLHGFGIVVSLIGTGLALSLQSTPYGVASLVGMSATLGLSASLAYRLFVPTKLPEVSVEVGPREFAYYDYMTQHSLMDRHSHPHFEARSSAVDHSHFRHGGHHGHGFFSGVLSSESRSIKSRLNELAVNDDDSSDEELIRLAR